MGQMVVDNIEDEITDALKLRAHTHGWSMEEEVRYILRQAVCTPAPRRTGLGTRIAQRFVTQGLTEALPELHGEIARTMDWGT